MTGPASTQRNEAGSGRGVILAAHNPRSMTIPTNIQNPKKWGRG